MSAYVANKVWKGVLFATFWIVVTILVAPPLAILWKGTHVFWNALEMEESVTAAFSSLQYASEFLSGLKNGALYALVAAFIVVVFCMVIVLSRVLSDGVENHYISWFFAYFAILALLIPPWSAALSVEQFKLVLTSMGGFASMLANSKAYVILILALFAMPFGLYFFMLRTIGEDAQLVRSWRETGAALRGYQRLVGLVHSLRHLYKPAIIAAFFTAGLVSFGDGGRTVRILRKDESAARFFEEVFRSASDEGLWLFAAIVVCIAVFWFIVVWYFLESD